MSRLRTLFLSLCLSLVVALAVPVSAQRMDVAGLEATQSAFRQIHNTVAPAVVSITSRVTATDDRTDDLYEFFFGTPPGPRTRSASGSGVIIRPEGLILTNSHVVQDAARLTVQLAGSTKMLPAEVLQTDPRTDLAVIRITEKGTYPTATLGDASKVQVGDWAIAFGSPFRLASTMTVGIISATGRNLPSPNDHFNYRDLLQTDASINPGNSGGPLVNIRGEIIGVNFMIFSPGTQSGSVGIGFAIPINATTKRIIDLMSAGKAPERGQLGVGIKDLDEPMRELYGVGTGGVFVDQVAPGKAAEKAGVQEEDVIVSFNGEKITDADQFVRLVENTAPGAKVPVVVVRDRKEMTFTVTVGAAPTATAARTTSSEQQLGLTVATLTREMINRFRLPVTGGVMVAQVEPGSIAEEAGLRRGDIILRVGSTEMQTKEEFWHAVNGAAKEGKQGILLRVRRGEFATTLTLELPADEKK